METNFQKSTVTAKDFFAIRRIAVMAMMTALTIIVARFCAININEGLRLSFENIPIILTSIWLGPVEGMIVGALSDVLGMLLQSFGGMYFPPLTVTPMVVALVSGLMAKVLFRNDLNLWKIVVTVVTADVLGTLLYGSLALTWYYQLILGKIDQTFAVIFVMRLAKSVTIATDAVLTYLLHRALYRRVICKTVLKKRK